MSIIKNYAEGKTVLNKLKYAGFNTGNEPIIQKKIPTAIGETPDTTNAITKRADDLARIATIMTRPEGLNYLFNESALSKVDIGKDDSKEGILKSLLSGGVHAVRTLGSTLLQVPVSGTGIHFVKGFEGNRGYLGKLYGQIVKNGGLYINTNELSGDFKFTGTSQELSDTATIYNTDNQSSVVEEYKSIDKGLAIENRVGLGNLAGDSSTKNISKEVKSRNFGYVKDINVVDPTTYDRINALDPFTDAGNKELTDLIKFRFEILNGNFDDSSTFLVFRALLDSIDDSYEGNWSSNQYLGRAESFHTYSGFNRNINFSFKVAAMSRYELAPIYNKLNYLYSTTAPTYSKDGYMRGTLQKLTIGSLFYELPGFIESLSVSWNNEYPWEIAMNPKGKSSFEGETNADEEGRLADVQELPMVLDVSVSFKPIHTFNPKTGNDKFITNPKRDPFLTK